MAAAAPQEINRDRLPWSGQLLSIEGARGYTSLPYRVISRRVSESNTALPKDLPPKSTVHDCLELWNWDGTLGRSPGGRHKNGIGQAWSGQGRIVANGQWLTLQEHEGRAAMLCTFLLQ